MAVQNAENGVVMAAWRTWLCGVRRMNEVNARDVGPG